MGFLKFFKKDDQLSKTNNNVNAQELETLFNIPLSERNSKWIDRFNILIQQYRFIELNPNNFEDKTGMNYLNLTFSNESDRKLKDYIDLSLKEGKGISINGNDKQADWIFTFGEILAYRMNGVLYSNQLLAPFGGEVTEKYFNKKQVMIGQPSDVFFPEMARKHIKLFFADMGLTNIRCALIFWRESSRLTLAFEVIPEMFDNPTNDSLKSLLGFVEWYLPNHYDVVFIKGDEFFQEI